MKKRFSDIKGLKKDKTAILLVGGTKELKFVSFKVVPSVPTDEQLAKINRFTRRPFTTDELYVGQLRLSNNCIDRDKERFSEEVIQRFVNTTLRRTMLFDHNRDIRDNAIGKYFDVELEKMPLQQAIAETGEELVLPDGLTEVWFHSPWFYIPKAGVDETIIVKIDAGIFDYGSIGFRCESLVPVMDKDGDIRFWEYRGTGINTEMREGSLVYLGAQYGMAVKDAGDHDTGTDPIIDKSIKDKSEQDKGGHMEKLKELLALFAAKFTKTFTEENVIEGIIGFISEKDAEITTLKGQVAELSPLAADGKAYREELITKYVTLKTKLEEIPADSPEKQADAKKVAASFPIEFLKSEASALQKRVDEKFPVEKENLQSEDPNKGRKEDKDWKVKNPLVVEDATA